MKAIVSAQQEKGSKYRTTVLNIDVIYRAPEDASFGCAGVQAAAKLAIENSTNVPTSDRSVYVRTTNEACYDSPYPLSTLTGCLQ